MIVSCKKLSLFVAVPVLAMLVFGAGSANAVPPAPAWKIVSLSVPTEFSAAAGSEFDIRVVNVGAAAANGIITVTDTLPAGLTTQATPHSVLAEAGRDSQQTTEEGWECTKGAGQRQVSCEYDLLPNGTLGELPVPALYQLPPIDIPVQVGTVAPGGSLENKVTAAEVVGGRNAIKQKPAPKSPSNHRRRRRSASSSSAIISPIPPGCPRIRPPAIRMPSTRALN